MPAIPPPQGPAYGVAARLPLPPVPPRRVRLYAPDGTPIDVPRIDVPDLIAAGYATEPVVVEVRPVEAAAPVPVRDEPAAMTAPTPEDMLAVRRRRKQE